MKIKFEFSGEPYEWERLLASLVLPEEGPDPEWEGGGEPGTPPTTESDLARRVQAVVQSLPPPRLPRAEGAASGPQGAHGPGGGPNSPWDQARATSTPDMLSHGNMPGTFSPPGFPGYDTMLSPAKIAAMTISEERTARAREKLKSTLVEWLRGWMDPSVPEADQPNRPALLAELSRGEWPVPLLNLIYARGSLQLVLYDLLRELKDEGIVFFSPDDDLDPDLINKLSAEMVAIATASPGGLKELTLAHDLNNTWRNE